MTEAFEQARALAAAGDPPSFPRIWSLAEDLDDAELRALDEALAAWDDYDRKVPALHKETGPVLRLARGWHMSGCNDVGWFADCADLSNLRFLTITGKIGPEGVATLARSAPLQDVHTLTLHGTGMRDEGAAALATGFERLRTLRLVGAQLGAEGVAAICQSPKFAKLETLMLAGASDDHAAALARTTLCLARLELPEAELTVEGFEAIASSTGLASVRALDLGDASPTAESLEVLLRGLPKLEALALANHEDLPLDALKGCTTLRRLDLQGCFFDDDDALALIGTPLLANLESIELGLDALSEDAIARIRAAVG
ncbi:MAG: hypothetical protein RIT81_35680 [Deltaproteobacteria bacterium]